MMNIDNLFYNIILYLSSVFEWMASMMFVNTIFKRQASKFKYNFLFVILLFLSNTALAINYLFIGEVMVDENSLLRNRFICKIAVLVFSCIFIVLVYKISSESNTICVVLPIIMLCTTNVLHIIIIHISDFIFPNYKWLFKLIFVLLIDYIFATVLYFSSKAVKKYKLIFYKKDISIILFSFCVSLIILVFLYAFLLTFDKILVNQLIIIVISIFAVLIMDTVIIKLLLRTAELNRTQKANEIKLIGQSLEQQYAKNIKEHDEAFRRMRHDFKHHMSVIDALINNNKIDEAKKYISDYLDSVKINTYVHTGNEYVNAILNSKITIAKKNDVNITSVVAGDICGIENVDMCNLLGNLLDNAIEGCLDTKEKSIVLKIVAEEQMIRISVSNTISKSVLENNSELITSKDDAENHGFGTKSIKNIASKYNGFADYFEENNKLFANITLVKEQVH